MKDTVPRNVKTKRLSNKEIREFLKENDYGIFTKKNIFEKVKTKDLEVLLIDRRPSFFFLDNKPVPTLNLIDEHDSLHAITVDKGAIRFVINGADIMRAGIVAIDPDIKQGECISVKEETHGKVLAIGISLFDAEILENLDSGKVIRNIHHIGDKIYNFKI